MIFVPVNVRQLCAPFSISALVSICGVLFSRLTECLLSVTHYSADHAGRDKSLVALNTVWESLYSLMTAVLSLSFSAAERSLADDHMETGITYHHSRSSLVIPVLLLSVFFSAFEGLKVGLKQSKVWNKYPGMLQ